MEINAVKKVRQWDMKEVAGTGPALHTVVKEGL